MEGVFFSSEWGATVLPGGTGVRARFLAYATLQGFFKKQDYYCAGSGTGANTAISWKTFEEKCQNDIYFGALVSTEPEDVWIVYQLDSQTLQKKFEHATDDMRVNVGLDNEQNCKFAAWKLEQGGWVHV